MTLVEYLEWFMDRVDPPPVRIHVRGVWADEEGGSHLGSPAWDPPFSRWILAMPSATTVVETEETCLHLGGRPCHDCGRLLEDGAMWETGILRRPQLRYRWPMRRTLYRLSLLPVRPGRPPLDTTLRTVEVMDGDLGRAQTALSLIYPIMASPTFAHGFFVYAFRRAYRFYDEQPDPLKRRPYGTASMQRAKSDSQLDAEAAGRVDSPEQQGPGQEALAAAGT